MTLRVRRPCPRCQRLITVTDGGMGTLRPHGQAAVSRVAADTERKDAK